MINLSEIDMVVLKRNDRKDANHIRPRDGKEYFKSSQNNFYHMLDGEWIMSTWENGQLEPQLKPIKEKQMKEYLVKSQDGKLRLETELVGDPADNVIEIPEGAEIYIELGGKISGFYKDNFKQTYFDDEGWVDTTAENSYDWLSNTILWQRNPEPKQAEFLVKTDSGYLLQVLDENTGGEDVVRIPDGAEIAILSSGVVYFWKSHFFNGGVNKDWVDMKGGWDASWYLKSVPSAIAIWKRETLNDQVASAEEYRKMISNAAIAQSCSGGAIRNASSQGQSEFPLNNYELNHRVAKAFNAVRGTDLNEDDVNYLRELINLTISHYGERK